MSIIYKLMLGKEFWKDTKTHGAVITAISSEKDETLPGTDYPTSAKSGTTYAFLGN